MYCGVDGSGLDLADRYEDQTPAPSALWKANFHGSLNSLAALMRIRLSQDTNYLVPWLYISLDLQYVRTFQVDDKATVRRCQACQLAVAAEGLDRTDL
ncbi:unnamed protein product [Fusarium fujikuroi]|uniref:Uncharacterized protein n=1 Tax=Fusarium fujikuroi TaxID=5127 RepID=A0A9Q9U9X1_FUSFU|nr:unnamed protein product [Fusarium fujikuroi]VTT79799.1 unnamed protein product [Fusarium fujikuroi]VZI07794.1 unnamed protein product [Fusarium fujikuroi]